MTRCARCNQATRRLLALPIVAKPGEPEQPTFELVCERCVRAPKSTTTSAIERLERALRKVGR